MTGRNNKPKSNGPKSSPGRLDQFGDAGSPEPRNDQEASNNDKC